MLRTEEEKNWYIRMTAKFFSDKEIVEIKSLPETKYGPNFSDFVICLYLEMLCSSIPDNGLILFGNMFLDNDNISYIVARKYGRTEKVGLVQTALIIMQNLKLIELGEIDEGKTVFIPAVVNNTGSSKLTSEQRRKRRIAAQSGKSYKELPNSAVADENNDMKKFKYGVYRNLFLSKSEFEVLREMVPAESIQKTINHCSKLKYLQTNGVGEKSKKTDFMLVKELLEKEETSNE